MLSKNAVVQILCLFVSAYTLEAADVPNIVVIITDDQGYGDISFNPYSPPEVSTPHMDSLARESVFFTQAYTNGNVCSPTRAALMTGRYSQRAGIYTAGEGGAGLPLHFITFPERLKERGYVSAAFGKWHMGLTEPYNPINRGFDHFYGFMGRGAHDYFDLAGEVEPDRPMYRGLKEIKDEGYLTHRLTEEAVDFIKSHKDQPFFVYLAYNAVHTPAQAPAETIAKYKKQYPHLSETRTILMAMLEHLDNGVGEVVKTLKEEGEWDNTLLFFLTDNGGARAMDADCSPLRGNKQLNYEGGIRTPFIVSWPERFGGGRMVHHPVITIDILPTAMDAAGIPSPVEQPLDGISLLPLLTGQAAAKPRNLYWSEASDRGTWAIRSGDWKLYGEKGDLELFNLNSDPTERHNLASTYPEITGKMQSIYDAWLDEMAEPMLVPFKRWNPSVSNTEENKIREQKRDAVSERIEPENT